MKKFVLAGIAAALAVPAIAGLGSGLERGERVVPFHPKHVVGPLAGTSNCFPCTFQNRPQVQVWVNGDKPENVARIAKTLSGAMNTYKGNEFKALVVFVTDAKSQDSVSRSVLATAKANKIDNVGMAVIAKDNEAIADYKINLDPGVKNTVFVYKNWQVANKIVNLSADDKGLATLSGAIASIAK
jgi:hypothetical protein